MLRPATPLTLLFFFAFVLLLISTISTPIVKGIPLASFNGVSFGVFGYCKPSGCSSIQIGYPIDAQTLFGDSKDDSDFSLPSSARSNLSSILIVHPVATLLTLICFILAASSHLHSPSHSPRYLLALVILSVPTFLVTLLAFLVDILLFVPKLAWGGWIVLASTILILASGIVTCAMRRTLVNRKARKKRIAENAEMNGENFYTRQAQAPPSPPPMDFARAESPPPLEPSMSGGLGSDKLPKFATFDTKTTEDDRVPLNTRTPSNKTLPSAPSSRGGYSEDGINRHAGPGRGGPPRGGMRGGRGGYNGPRDEYGNPLPPSNAFGPVAAAGMRRDQSEPPRVRNQYSDENMNFAGYRGRGRGGHGPPRGYGRGGPYGPAANRGRGGYGRGGGIPMGPMAGGAGAGMAARDWSREQEQPPPGYGYGYGNGNNAYPPQDRPGQYEGPGPAGYGRSPSAPGYGRRPSPGPPSAPGGYGRGPSPGPPSAPGGYGRRPSPGPPSAPGTYNRGPSPGPPSNAAYGYQREPSPEPPMPSPPLPMSRPREDQMIGQAVEMDARTGSPALRSPTMPHSQPLRDSDSDVQGFVGLQQKQQPRDSDSLYTGTEPYVPPRAAWNGTSTRGATSPKTTTAIDPVELPSQNTPRMHRPRSSSLPQNQFSNHRRNQSSADNYYEDVDPRFAPEPHNTTRETQITQHTESSSNTVPHTLIPGVTNVNNRHHQPVHPTIETVNPNGSYESLQDDQDGLVSPAASENSNMTSISQRGVNPNWRPSDGQRYGGQANLGVPGRKPLQQQQREMGPNTNQHFEMSGGRGPVIPREQQGQAF